MNCSRRVKDEGDAEEKKVATREVFRGRGVGPLRRCLRCFPSKFWVVRDTFELYNTHIVNRSTWPVHGGRWDGRVGQMTLAS